MQNLEVGYIKSKKKNTKKKLFTCDVIKLFRLKIRSYAPSSPLDTHINGKDIDKIVVPKHDDASYFFTCFNGRMTDKQLSAMNPTTAVKFVYNFEITAK